MAGISDLAKDFATKFSVPQTQGKAAVQFIFEAIQTRLTNNEDVAVRGFGTFKTKQLGERTIKNPRTHEEVVLAPSKRALFTPGSELKASINGRTKVDETAEAQDETVTE